MPPPAETNYMTYKEAEDSTGCWSRREIAEVCGQSLRKPDHREMDCRNFPLSLPLVRKDGTLYNHARK